MNVPVLDAQQNLVLYNMTVSAGILAATTRVDAASGTLVRTLSFRLVIGHRQALRHRVADPGHNRFLSLSSRCRSTCPIPAARLRQPAASPPAGGRQQAAPLRLGRAQQRIGSTPGNSCT